ncbi:hypothetical protein CY35_07G016600 [Sphagnum magellanicum]|uniref:Uncharacterized protein n=1 Tax=Sphagnum magellanicum TaxID=128215 RepID=A0ACB8HJ52_9BRYO|nr:hypothetical protein CY35_07G016600 [Sphagnum magellanicum]
MPLPLYLGQLIGMHLSMHPTCPLSTLHTNAGPCGCPTTGGGYGAGRATGAGGYGVRGGTGTGGYGAGGGPGAEGYGAGRGLGTGGYGAGRGPGAGGYGTKTGGTIRTGTTSGSSGKRRT